jgi:hypothetical protein
MSMPTGPRSSWRCPICGELGPNLCDRCLIKNYCSRECQLADWPSHKRECVKKRSKKKSHRNPQEPPSSSDGNTASSTIYETELADWQPVRPLTSGLNIIIHHHREFLCLLVRFVVCCSHLMLVCLPPIKHWRFFLILQWKKVRLKARVCKFNLNLQTLAVNRSLYHEPVHCTQSFYTKICSLRDLL